MVESIKVAFFGATGESAGLILNGLLDSKEFDFQVTALARASSIDKPGYARIRQRGVKVTSIELDGPEDELVSALEGIDVVIASVPPTALESQLPLIRASKKSGVKRFLPSAYAMAIGPKSGSTVQNEKEKVYAELERLQMPYTIIDVGWWHFGFIPRLPSGRTDYAIALPDLMVNMIPGDGNTKTCLVDPQDIGQLVARIIVDPRTINKRVMANGDAMTLNDVYDIVTKATSENVERKYASADQLEGMIQQIDKEIEAGSTNYMTFVTRFWLQYYRSNFIQDDNSPEAVQRLGYVMVKDLYPDYQPIKFEQFFQDILEGKRRVPYS